MGQWRCHNSRDMGSHTIRVTPPTVHDLGSTGRKRVQSQREPSLSTEPAPTVARRGLVRMAPFFLPHRKRATRTGCTKGKASRCAKRRGLQGAERRLSEV